MIKVPDSCRRPKPEVSNQDFWIDPDPSRQPGLLLSDRILFYCEKVNLVFPYDPSFVEPASYTLHAGREYMISPKPGKVETRDLEKEGKVIIPPNGLIYIRFFEEVNIPHYMIARFNLRVTQVYRGLLLGTGPQVDPGFRGYLGCPIHNFTDEDKAIEFFDPLGTIDFEKSTPLGETYFRGLDIAQITDEEYAGMRSGTISVPGINGLHCKIFNKRVNAMFQSYLPGGESVRSSVAKLNEDVKAAQRKIERYRNIAILSVIGLTLTVLFWLHGLYINLKNDIVELSKSVGRLEGTVQSRPTIPTVPERQRTEEKSPPASEQKAKSKQPEAKPAQ